MSTPKITRVGLLGAGYIAQWHAQAIKQIAHVKVCAVCDPILERAKDFAASIGAEHVFDHADSMLGQDVCDAVHVLAPPALHFAMAQQVLLAGKHVLVEKPMCLTHSDCTQLADTARTQHLKLGVNHNFLFLPSYERLKQDVDQGMLGKIDQVTLNWCLPLGLLHGGPWDHWMFSESANLLLEIGPHVFAFVEHLVGSIKMHHVGAQNPFTLPGGKQCYRRWTILGQHEHTGLAINLSFADAYPGLDIQVQGSAGRATCDYGRDLYVIQRPNKHGMIVEPLSAAWHVASQLARGAVTNFCRQARSMDRLSPFGLSITRSLQAFYQQPGDSVDPRHAGDLGAKVVALARQVADAADLPSSQTAEPTLATTSTATLPTVIPQSQRPTILVLGGTGFIGRHLVNSLVGDGHTVRVMSRSKAAHLDLHGGSVELLTGSLASQSDLAEAMDGIEVVFHLARADCQTWSAYLKQDVQVTELIGQCSLAAGVKRFIYTGTIDSYDSATLGSPITQATGLDPKILSRNLYARSKAACEDVLGKMHRDQKLPLVIVRPGIVIGPGTSPQHWGVAFWQSPTVCTLYGRGVHKLPFVLVDDVVDGLMQVMKTDDIEGQSFNFVGDPLLSAHEYIQACEQAGLLGLQVHTKSIASYYAFELLKFGMKKTMGKENALQPSYHDWQSRTHRRPYQNDKAKQQLGWNPASSQAQLVQRGIEPMVRQWCL